MLIYQTLGRLLLIAERRIPQRIGHNLRLIELRRFRKSGKSGKVQPRYLIRNAPGSPLLPGAADMERTRQLTAGPDSSNRGT